MEPAWPLLAIILESNPSMIYSSSPSTVYLGRLLPLLIVLQTSLLLLSVVAAPLFFCLTLSLAGEAPTPIIFFYPWLVPPPIIFFRVAFKGHVREGHNCALSSLSPYCLAQNERQATPPILYTSLFSLLLPSLSLSLSLLPLPS